MSKESVRVLVAEDDYLVGEMVKGLLEEGGHLVIGEAADGREAIEMTASLKPDVVVMDIQMPEVDGIKAAREIQSSCPTPVVILTAYETPDLVDAASAAGVGAYLIKLPTAREVDRAITIAVARFADMMELRRLNSELETRNEELDAFAHTVAHDLKNSVTPVIGLSEMLSEGLAKMTPEKMRRYLGIITQSARKMWNVIDELLMLAEVRQSDVRLEVLDMNQVVASVRQRLAFAIEEHKAELVSPANWPTVRGHGPWVEEVWINFIDNALKYGGQPPRVELGAVEQPDGTVRFWVRDNGEGLTPEEQGSLFGSRRRNNLVRAKGSGLGLSIVRRIVEKLGGRVGLESQPGMGSTFWFALPR